MLKPKIGCYVLYEPTEEGWEQAAAQFKISCDELRTAGMDVIEAPEPVSDERSCLRAAEWFKDKDTDILHVLIITWSFDHFATMIQQHNRIPIAIRTIPGIKAGSVVGGQQLGCLLSDLEIEHKLFYGALGNSAVVDDTTVYARACALKKCLSGARFGMVGRRTPGMTPVAFDEVEIMRLFGSRIINIGMDELNEIVNTINSDDAEAEWMRISSAASTVCCSKNDGISSSKFYLALKRLAEVNKLDAMAIGCYPSYMGKVCMPIALLNNEGIAAGCEGDMNSTIMMFLLNKLTGKPVHFGEMLDIDEVENTIISSHCGAAAPSLANSEGHMISPVRLAHTGTCIRYKSMTGPVTYVNLVGRKGNYRMCAVEGHALETEMVFEGNPMKIKLNVPFRNIWDGVSRYGFGHHWMAVYQHVSPALKEFCTLTGLQGFFPGHEVLI
jgi:L-fucose isomerase-like protein